MTSIQTLLRWLAGAMATLLVMTAIPVVAQDELPLKEGADPVTAVQETDPEMNAAIAKAQRTLPKFLAYLANPPAETQYMSFKFPLNGWEHIWVSEVRRDGDHLIGALANNPHADGYSLGDPVRVPISDVSDWGYFGAANSMEGHFTTRVVLDRLPPAEAAEIRASFGWAE